ncbi:phosphate regulon sensor histidine kinase PhoR [Sansalvadorimonas verongulae]|uniref:phosphate regulon sensor histidine kinase PhoR n=1 Tax=Sansalvadorimonas verongulae TaxID=2172824 RepID=UPI002E379246|nr:phosphate regulon sensor histidine kinase PhoR [Sansalvadorimonas verongulae]MTI13588.1 phosphate regulon sensor histidine kinase PhoR [Sansalvadorimonas verongulae]
MNQNWQIEVTKRLFLMLGACIGIGLLTGKTILVLLIGCGLYLLWTLKNVIELIRWLETAASSSDPVDPPNGHGLWGEIFDASYRLMRKQERARDRLKAVINRFQESTSALRDAVVLTNDQGQIEWWNPAAEHILGLRNPDDAGQVITNLIRHPRFLKYFENKAYQDPLLLPSPVSTEKKLLVSITLYGPENRLLVARDNTRVFQLEQMTKDFVANVSHELRTPLTVISGYVETLLDTLELMLTAPPPVLSKALNQMQSQSDRMANIIEDLLILSKLETADSLQDLVPVSIFDLLHDVAADARTFSGDRSHSIEVSCKAETAILGNEKELRSAISNLVFNAVKYTPDNGNIKLKWVVELNTGYLSIKDNGIGIDPQHIPRLTERFYRIDKSRHASTGGSGLGLSIVKHVLLRHDATLLIKSRPGRGSSFTCHFPQSRLVVKEAA